MALAGGALAPATGGASLLLDAPAVFGALKGPGYVAPPTGLDPMIQQDQAMRDKFMALLPQLTGEQQQVLMKQLGLADNLNNTITNPNATSVAQLQLQKATAANESAQASQASGLGGADAAVARRNVGYNTATLGGGEDLAAALTRAQEVATAQGQEGSVLSSAGGEIGNAMNTATTAGVALNSQAGTLAGTQQGQALSAQEFNIGTKNALQQSMMKLVAGGISGYFGTKGAAGGTPSFGNQVMGEEDSADAGTGGITGVGNGQALGVLNGSPSTPGTGPVPQDVFDSMPESPNPTNSLAGYGRGQPPASAMPISGPGSYGY